jgi:hypothetical protein
VNKKAIRSLQKIKEYAQKGRLGACYSIFAPAYYDPSKDTYCAIGCLIPETIRDRIINEFGLDDAITLWKFFPELEKNTGIAANEAQLIQELNDKLWREESRFFSLKYFPKILEYIIQAGEINCSVLTEALYKTSRHRRIQPQARNSQGKTKKHVQLCD